MSKCPNVPSETVVIIRLVRFKHEQNGDLTQFHFPVKNDPSYMSTTTPLSDAFTPSYVCDSIAYVGCVCVCDCVFAWLDPVRGGHERWEEEAVAGLAFESVFLG